jgi:hypothetical protein
MYNQTCKNYSFVLMNQIITYMGVSTYDMTVICPQISDC